MTLWNQFTSVALASAPFLLLAGIMVGILALYFLKLRRQPLAVPSTYLWSRTIEDLHVNSLWQRLRQSLLLFLQLLLIILLALTLLRPGYKGSELLGNRFIFLIDKSASMSATDVGPSRLDEAKRQVKTLIDKMKSGDQAMIISFSNRATPDQSYTTDRRLLRTKVDLIQPTNHTSDLNEALRAASGLANPGQSGDPNNPDDQNAAEPMPATLYILSDGGFSAVKNFRLGNLDPQYLKIGTADTTNVAIVAFSTGHSPDKPDRVEAFGRLENYGFQPATVDATLYIGGALGDAQKVEIPARDGTPDKPGSPGSAGVKFELTRTDELEKDGILRLEIDAKDQLLADNKAYAVVSAPRPAKVLVATPGNNDALLLALATEEAQKVAFVTIIEPKRLADKAIQKELQEGAYDLVIYDQCAPPPIKETPPTYEMPAANTLFIGRLPPGGAWTAGPKQGPPIFSDADQVHPLSQLVRMENVKIVEGTPLKGPPGTTTLLEFSDMGPLYAVAPRGGYEDAVLGFEIFSTGPDGKTEVNTNWPVRRSFPVFVMNAVRYLGGVKAGSSAPSTKPGFPAILRAQIPVAKLLVQSPRGDGYEVPRETQNTYIFSRTDDLGVYDVREGSGKKITQKFVVNLFDGRESDLSPAEKLEIEHEEVAATKTSQNTRKEFWKWILLGAIGLLIFEWYIYNRRVYL